jgi:hypothetical protein
VCQAKQEAKVFWFFFSKKNFFLKKEAKTFATSGTARRSLAAFALATWGAAA